METALHMDNQHGLLDHICGIESVKEKRNSQQVLWQTHHISHISKEN